MTGVDLSPGSLEVARRLAARTASEVTWVESDVLDARAAVQGDVDVVCTSIGTICWVGDLHRWARQVAGLLRPGGVFHLRDGHPMLLALASTSPTCACATATFRAGDTLGRRRHLRRRGAGGASDDLRVAAPALRGRGRPPRRRARAGASRRGPHPALASHASYDGGRAWPVCLPGGRARPRAVHLHRRRPAAVTSGPGRASDLQATTDAPADIRP
nr:class I SAM-dependent methyltransferase [Arsenicicoccus dermatophilus]